MVKKTVSITPEQAKWVDQHFYKLSKILQSKIRELMDADALDKARLAAEYPPLVIINKSKMEDLTANGTGTPD